MDLKFTESERIALDYERYHHPHPKVQRRMEVLWLKSQGKAAPEISQLANVSLSSVYRYLGQYQRGHCCPESGQLPPPAKSTGGAYPHHRSGLSGTSPPV